MNTRHSAYNDSPPTPHDEIAGLREEIAVLRKQLQQLRAGSTADRLERSILQDQLRSLQHNYESVNDRLNGIYRSLTWRTLISVGKLITYPVSLLQITRHELHLSFNRLRFGLFQRFAPGTDEVRIHSDFPQTQNATLLYGEAEICGWASAKSGIAKLEIFIANEPVETVQYGIERKDVAAYLPGFSDADHSGYKALIKASQFPKRRHELRIVATSRTGHVEQLLCPVDIDPRAPYELWLDRNSITKEQRERMNTDIGAFSYRPKFSIITPVYKTPEKFLARCIESVRDQVYPNWELIVVDDGSQDARLRELLDESARVDDRIRVYFQSQNSGIALATNEALRYATGEFVAFLDHDDELAPHALFEVVNELNRHDDWDVFYSDEDKLTTNGHHADPFFKPDWSPDLLLSENYVCHFLVCRRALIEQVGGLRPGFEGSQDFDLILRMAERTNKIRRIPKVLYHWRISASSTAGSIEQKPAASEAGLRALQEHLDRTAYGAIASELRACRYRVHYPLRGEPEVEVIIPSGGNPRLETAIRSVIELSTYPSIRITVVDNSSDNSVQRIVRRFSISSRSIRILDCKVPFNFSLLCNRAATTSVAPFLLFLNDDTSIITQDWIEAMLEHAQRKEIGAVGPLLLFPDNRIQHAGVILGVYGMAGHSFRMLDAAQQHYFCFSSLIRNCSAVTGACLLVRRETFFEVGGFEEAHLPLAFQDVDLCLKLQEKGYRIIFTPHAKLYHFESATKTKIADQSEIDYMKHRWGRYIFDDPYYNPNLTRTKEDYSILVEESAPRVGAL